MHRPDDEERRSAIGSYLLGDLDGARRNELERHLLDCPSCLAECADLGPLVSAMATFPADETADLIARYGLPDDAGTDPQPQAGTPGQPPAGTAGQPQAAARSADSRPVGRRPAGDRRPDVGPAGRRDASRPASGSGGSGPPRSGIAGNRRLLINSLAVVVLLTAGILIGLHLNDRSGQDDQRHRPVLPPVSLAATAADASTSLSVTVVTRPGGVGIRAVVIGLTEGQRYRLHGVTADGTSHLITEWIGGAAATDLTGELPVSVDSLAFFTVTRLDGTAVVSATVVRATSAGGSAPTRGGR